MLRKLGRLFIIKNRLEAMLVIYALAVGAVERGDHYMQLYPGFAGKLLFLACTCAVFMAGARLMEVTRKDSGERRRHADLDHATGALTGLPTEKAGVGFVYSPITTISTNV